MPQNSDPFPVPASAPAVGPVKLADGLGWASAGLGAPMLLTPRRFLRSIGVRADGTARLVTLGVGAREFMAFTTIVGMRHRRVGTWSRVAGDLIDLSLLAVAYRTRREHARRLFGFAGFVAGILGADLYAAVQLSRAEGVHVEDGSTSTGSGAAPEPAAGPSHVRTAITIRGSETEIKEAFLAFGWSAFDAGRLVETDHVRFVTAPGDRGVEIHLDFDPAVRAGRVGAAALKLAGQAPDQTINDELRRFKSLTETGVEVRSDKTPAGHSAFGQIFQRPGQPVEGTS